MKYNTPSSDRVTRGKLALGSLVAIAKVKPLLFLTILTVLTVTIFGMLHSMGSALDIFISRLDWYAETRTVEIVTETMDSAQITKLVDELSGNGFPKIYRMNILPRQPEKQQGSRMFQQTSGTFTEGSPIANGLTVIGEYDTINSGFVAKGQYFSGLDDGNVCIFNPVIVADEPDKYDLGNQVHINGVNYTVTGALYYSRRVETIILPVKTYLESGLEANYIICTYKDKLTASQADRLADILIDYPVDAVQMPKRFEQRAIGDLLYESSAVAVIVILSILILLPLTRGWLKASVQIHSGKLNSVGMRFLSIFLLSASAYIIGLVGYKLLLENKSFVLGAHLDICNYILVFFFITVIPAIFSTLQARTRDRAEPR